MRNVSFAATQTTCCPDVADNLSVGHALVRQATAQGAQVIVLQALAAFAVKAGLRVRVVVTSWSSPRSQHHAAVARKFRLSRPGRNHRRDQPYPERQRRPESLAMRPIKIRLRAKCETAP